LFIPVIVSAGRNSPGKAGLVASVIVIVTESETLPFAFPAAVRLPVYVPAHTDVGVDVSIDVAPPPPQAVRKRRKQSAIYFFINFTSQMEGAGDRFFSR
jgi:hypothetical protein